ncbi:hypothetical protein [Ornithinibacillus halophilus]|uniref:Uncharacterized protein n=1 Tax=Ornithinibacillus halophilus TaxID=930117 RepID=A0A1M5LMT9_9BACI|nr:hypothetical protein [Ornithinibacillus halophilus]SHG65643.1 hypothetical protein SAMN05216225_104815 [Ornithinibacillus halophilus]
MSLLIIYIVTVVGGFIWYLKKQKDYETSLLKKKVEESENLKRTLAMGLAYRFNFPTQKNDDGETTYKNATDIF